MIVRPVVKTAAQKIRDKASPDPHPNAGATLSGVYASLTIDEHAAGVKLNRVIVTGPVHISASGVTGHIHVLKGQSVAIGDNAVTVASRSGMQLLALARLRM